MVGPIERGVLTGFGAFLFMQEKAAEAVRDMMERGRLAPEEGRRFMEDLSRRFDEAALDVQAQTRRSFQEALDSVGVATEGDIKDIRAHLAKLENRLDDLEGLKR